VQRKLAAILSADVVGYSRLMEANESGTLDRLKANRQKIFQPHVDAHGGRVVKLMGDGALVEFPSVVAAVNCALEIQEAMAHAEQDLPEADRIRYRIGVNLGDVIIEGDDIYGDGVNVAARIQALGAPGSVAISQTVRDHVAGKVTADFEDLGEHALKNIERPVRVFALHRAGAMTTAHAQPERAQRISICVLPFANMSGDPEQEYFSDGITEDIITDLSKVSALFVVSRNSAFSFKGKHVDVQKIAREFHVSHILEGSVRKSGGRVRITAQLIDGASNGHVWAERYDRDLNDIFALQDEISEAIVKALRLKLLPEEKKAIEQRGTANPDAYDLYLMARRLSVSGNQGSARQNETIIRLCQRATEIDPNYARAWALIANAQGRLRFYLGREGENGLAAAERALALDNSLAEAHAAKAEVLTRMGQYDEARREIEIALRQDSESYEVNCAAARYYFATRQFKDAIRHYEKAATLMDTDYNSAGMLGSCYKALDDEEGNRRSALLTLSRTEKILAQEPDNGSALGYSFGALITLGEVERAKDRAKRALLLDPDNLNMRYNFACAFIAFLKEYDAGFELLGPLFEKIGIELLNHAL